MIFGIDASRAERVEKTGVEWYAARIIEHLKKIIPPQWEVVLYSEKSLPWPPRFLWTHLRLSWEMLRRPPDVLFVPAHVLPIICPRRSVVTIHDVAFRAHPEAYSFLARKYLDWAARVAVRRAARIIVPTRAVAGDLLKYYNAKPPQVVVVPHAATVSHQDQKVDDRQENGTPYFLTIGRNAVKKNILRIVEAFERAQERSAVVRGMRLVQIGKDGHMPHEEVERTLAGATALAFPSIAEGFGLPILDAMTLGVPVITSYGHATEEVAGGAALLVDPTDTDAIADAIVRIAKDSALRSDLAARGRTRAAAFSWEHSAQATYDAIRDIISS